MKMNLPLAQVLSRMGMMPLYHIHGPLNPDGMTRCPIGANEAKEHLLGGELADSHLSGG